MNFDFEYTKQDIYDENKLAVLVHSCCVWIMDHDDCENKHPSGKSKAVNCLTFVPCSNSEDQ